jgi:hypothetical protein
MDWSDREDIAAYRECEATTRMFEELWFKYNIEYWIMHPEAELPTANPWLSVMGTWEAPNRFVAPIYKRQMGLK